MGARFRDPRPRSAVRQRGQAIFLTALIVFMGVAAALYATLNATSISLSNRQAEHDARVLAQVKDALIAWSAARTPTATNLNARPGELPCPDTDNNGYAENDDNNDGVDTTGCVAGAIGRVPWKTLGIPEPKDSAGETLWYAISGNFRIYRSSGTASHIYTSPITSDTLGTLTVYQNSTSSTLTSQAVAVLFAPGLAQGAQNRSTTDSMSCTAPSGTYFRNQCASNYLETLGSVNNAANNGPYIQGASSSTFNDRSLTITNADLMPLVEQRVAREMMSLLERYRIYRFSTAGTYDYPSADASDGDSNARYNRHRFPCGDAVPTTWSAAGITLPNWLTNGCGSNGWASVIYYAVAKNRLVDNDCDSAICSTGMNWCSGTTLSSTTRLTVVNASGRVAYVCTTGASPFTCTPAVPSTGLADLILITPGAASSSRASGWPTTDVWDPISGYFEDSANSDNDVYNCFVVPTSTNQDRDRIYVVPYP